MAGNREHNPREVGFYPVLAYFCDEQHKKMNKPHLTSRFGIIAGLIFFAAMSRLLPHPHNFTPIGAMALFGAAHFRQKHLAFLVPLAALWLSDLVINNVVYPRVYPEYYHGFRWFSSFWIYGSFAAIAGLGLLTLRQLRFTRVLGASLGASLLFYLVTNFGAWLGSSFYPQDFSGLMASYIAGLPFFWNTLGGDLCYSALLFGSFAYLQYRVPALAR